MPNNLQVTEIELERTTKTIDQRREGKKEYKPQDSQTRTLKKQKDWSEQERWNFFEGINHSNTWEEL